MFPIVTELKSLINITCSKLELGLHLAACWTTFTWVWVFNFSCNTMMYSFCFWLKERTKSWFMAGQDQCWAQNIAQINCNLLKEGINPVLLNIILKKMLLTKPCCDRKADKENIPTYSNSRWEQIYFSAKKMWEKNVLLTTLVTNKHFYRTVKVRISIFPIYPGKSEFHVKSPR